MPVRTNVHTFTILSGQSLSDVMAVNATMGEAIIMPDAWDAAGLSFAASETLGGTYLPLFDGLGVELVLTVLANQRIVLPLGLIRSHAFLRVRSGTSAAAVNQTANRSVTMLTRDFS